MVELYCYSFYDPISHINPLYSCYMHMIVCMYVYMQEPYTSENIIDSEIMVIGISIYVLDL